MAKGAYDVCTFFGTFESLCFLKHILIFKNNKLGVPSQEKDFQKKISCSMLAHQSRSHSILLAITVDWHCAKRSLPSAMCFPELTRVEFVSACGQLSRDFALRC